MSKRELPSDHSETDRLTQALALAKDDLRYLRSWVAESQVREREVAVELAGLRTSEAEAEEQAQTLRDQVAHLSSELAATHKALRQSEARHSALLASTTYRTGLAIRESASLRGALRLPKRLVQARRPQTKTPQDPS